MSREIIAVDIDEVLFPFVREFLAWYNPKYATSWEQEHFKSYRFEDVTKRSVPETMEDIYEFCAFANLHIEPIEEAQSAIKTLNENYDLVLLTARHPDYKDPIEAWTQKHFQGMFKSLDMIGYDLVMERPRTKAEVCKDLGAFILIDDSVSHVIECATQGVESILFGDYPWNQIDILPKGVTQCEDWKSVLEFINARN